jgi:DNA-binding NtrC family response regulator
MGLPRVLIIDDLFGGSLRDRRNFCKNFGLVDVTGDEAKPLNVVDPIAEAVFESSQDNEGNSVINSSQKALDAVVRGWGGVYGNRLALVLLDLRFVSGQRDEDGDPEGNPGDDLFGLELLGKIHAKLADLPVIIISSTERSEVIEDCRRHGASDFIQRHEYATTSSSAKELLQSKLLEHGLIEDNRILSDERYRIVGSSVGLLKTLRSARRVATGKGNILLLGESGTGKELLARYIHDMSPKAKGPYKVHDPSGRAETLQEDELFGHARGAFTGADSERPGLLELANGGTLLIDEIGEVPESLQTKLLRPLENWSVRRQGGRHDISLDLQVILATNKNLDLYVQEKKFKSDLLNRIKAYPIIIPPLRERKEDIPRIADQLLQILCAQHNARWPRKIHDDTIELLKGHFWIDNVRGLRNVLQRAVFNNKDSELVVPQDIHFDSYQSETPPKNQTTTEVALSIDSLDTLLKEIENFKFPLDYELIHGKLPKVQHAVAVLMAKYLQAAVEVTKKRKPGTPAAWGINMTGAVSCMAGTQLKTPKAADFIKKLLQQDMALHAKLPVQFPILDRVYNEAVRLRPKKPRNND